MASKGSGCGFWLCSVCLSLSYLPLWSYFSSLICISFGTLENTNPTYCLGHIWFNVARMPLMDKWCQIYLVWLQFFFSPYLADRERLIRVGVPLSYFWGRSLLGNKLQNCIFEMHRSISVVWWFGNEALIIRLNSKRKLFLLVVPCQLDRFIECTYFSGEH